ncbi:MAG: histone deacetylase family protein [Desulfurococcaceae archaeon]
MPLVLFLRESMEMHAPSFYHPENPARARIVYGVVKQLPVEVREVSALVISEEEALRLAERIHAKGYLNYLVELQQKAPAMVDPDTYLSRDSLKLALAALYYSYTTAAEARDQVFLVLRPPGHHAGRGGRAMGAETVGFCLLNNAVAAVLGFLDRGFKKIAVIDFDAHHGNGTMEILYEERILQVDFHQDPKTLYPHTGYPDELGKGRGYGYKANIVLPVGSGDDLFLKLLERAVEVVGKYAPEALVVSAGFDGFADDGLADLRLTEVSYYELGAVVRRLGAPAVVVLEGGYGLGLHRGVSAFIEGLLGEVPKYSAQTKTSAAKYREAVETATRVLEVVESRALRSD